MKPRTKASVKSYPDATNKKTSKNTPQKELTAAPVSGTAALLPDRMLHLLLDRRLLHLFLDRRLLHLFLDRQLLHLFPDLLVLLLLSLQKNHLEALKPRKHKL